MLHRLSQERVAHGEQTINCGAGRDPDESTVVHLFSHLPVAGRCCTNKDINVDSELAEISSLALIPSTVSLDLFGDIDIQFTPLTSHSMSSQTRWKATIKECSLQKLKTMLFLRAAVHNWVANWMNEVDVDEFFDQLDDDQYAMLTRTQCAPEREQQRDSPVGVSSKDAFFDALVAHVDTNHDGVISEDEFLSGGGSREDFLRFDVDNDGVLDDGVMEMVAFLDQQRADQMKIRALHPLEQVWHAPAITA